MPRSSYGYDPYRGRSRVRPALAALIVILLTVLLLAIAFFFFAQPYIVYGDDGKAHLELPFFQSEPTPTPEPTSPAVVVVTPEPTPSPTPAPGETLAQLPLDALTDGTAETLVQRSGATGAIFQMKAESGALGYVSAQDMAVNSRVNSAVDGVNEAIARLNAGELYTVARISCFKDDAVPYQYGRWAGFRIPEGNWRGADGSRWLSPATSRARDYITGICLELCALGFDELWLDWNAFPVQGQLDWIIRGDAYNDATLEEDLEEFYAQVRSAVKEQYPQVVLSFTAEKGALLSDEEDLSGQTAALLAKYADKVYLPLPQEGEDFTQALDALDMEPGQLIYLTDGVSPEGAGRIVTP